MADGNIAGYNHIIGIRTDSVKPILEYSQNNCREANMAAQKTSVKSGKSYNYTSYWKQQFVTSVTCNGFSSFDKLVFMRIASFGEKGCWMTNRSMAEELGRSESNVTRAISRLWGEGHLVIKAWNGHGRTIYARNIPQVRQRLTDECNNGIRSGKYKSVEDYRAKVRMR